uniref:ORF104 n=1 Tax=Pieris brassicae granulosis virus TaxID=10465 RepID=A0A7G9U8R2_GVPB|nr:ORF104 [Pieris brassicae granulovirus]
MGLCCNSCLDKINISEIEDGAWEDDEINQNAVAAAVVGVVLYMFLLIVFTVCIIVLYPTIYLAIKTKFVM